MSDQLSLFGEPDGAPPDGAPTSGAPPDRAPTDGAPTPETSEDVTRREAASVAAPAAVLPREDAAAREYAIDPRRNVVLEASAGTGKTSVLVRRYLNLLWAGVDPSNILAITFTRKAAAEMRERIVLALRQASTLNAEGRAKWVELRDRLNDVAISTIDAFCYGLLREFPLEAGLDPAFTLADETEIARLIEESLDHTLRICRRVALDDPAVALLLARLTAPRLRSGLAHLLERRLVAWDALGRYVLGSPRRSTVDELVARGVERMQAALRGLPGGVEAFIADGPRRHPRFRLLEGDLRAIEAGTIADGSRLAAVLDEIRAYFLTQAGKARTKMTGYRADQALSQAAWKRHCEAVRGSAPSVKNALDAWARDLNVVLARGVQRVFGIALDEYRRTLSQHDVLDFSEVLSRAVELLRQMDEFAQSRYRLESRYHHVLMDEFQDTSRMQWELVALLVQSWGEGFGLVHEAPLPPTLFVVGDRKQSIYRFRDADVSLLDEAAVRIGSLRPEHMGGGPVRRYISHSFRSTPALLQFVNDVCGDLPDASSRPDAFTYDERDRFPIDDEAGDALARAAAAGETALGVAAAETIEACAAAVADEIVRLLQGDVVRDRDTGVRRPARPGDLAILFRSRDSHREFEQALDARGLPSYVYKGLGFFDADEIKDVTALLRYLAAPDSDLRAAALLRSRFVRLSDAALLRLGPRLADAVRHATPPAAEAALDEEDRRVLAQARTFVPVWLSLVDRLPPAEVVDHVLAASAYGDELTGPRGHQARENVKKMRALVRRIQNRGYATIGRLAEHLDRLSAGDEANAIIEAIDAVSLMTVHASKGLEFPIVFLVNLSRGVAARRPPVRVQADPGDEEPSVAIESFVSEADVLEPAREREETKRLLYVALTRARDRLYLSTLLKDGAFRPTAGSLGRVLPESIGRVFEQAGRSSSGTLIPWTSRDGNVHRFRSVSSHETSAQAGATSDSAADADTVQAARADLVQATAGAHASQDESQDLDESRGATPSPALLPVAAVSHARVPVTGQDPAPAVGGFASMETSPADRQQALAGRLVHRLFHAGVSPGDADEDLAAAALRLVRPEEQVDIDDIGRLGERAASVYRALAGRPAVRDLLTGGRALYEVPFSLRGPAAGPAGGAADVGGRAGGSTGAGEVIYRGTIDCLVERPDGSLVVLEFKTGAPRPAHERQLALYVEAARILFANRSVDGHLVYP